MKMDSVCGCMKDVFVSMFEIKFYPEGIDMCGYCRTILECRRAWSE